MKNCKKIVHVRGVKKSYLRHEETHIRHGTLQKNEVYLMHELKHVKFVCLYIKLRHKLQWFNDEIF